MRICCGNMKTWVWIPCTQIKARRRDRLMSFQLWGRDRAISRAHWAASLPKRWWAPRPVREPISKAYTGDPLRKIPGTDLWPMTCTYAHTSCIHTFSPFLPSLDQVSLFVAYWLDFGAEDALCLWDTVLNFFYCFYFSKKPSFQKKREREFVLRGTGAFWKAHWHVLDGTCAQFSG